MNSTQLKVLRALCDVTPNDEVVTARKIATKARMSSHECAHILKGLEAEGLVCSFQHSGGRSNDPKGYGRTRSGEKIISAGGNFLMPGVK